MTGPSLRGTPYPKPSDAVGNTATAIRAVAEAYPPPLVLPAGSGKLAMVAKDVVVSTDAAYGTVTWTQDWSALFTRVDGYLHDVRRSSRTASGGAFYNRGVFVYPLYAAGVPYNPLPLTGAELVMKYGLATPGGSGGQLIPAATYTVDILAWGV